MASISPHSVSQQFISPFSVENIISKKNDKNEETLNHSGSSSNNSANSGYSKYSHYLLSDNILSITVSMVKDTTERASSNTSRSSSPEIISQDRGQAQGLNSQDSCYRRYRTAFTRFAFPLYHQGYPNIFSEISSQLWKKSFIKKITSHDIDDANWQQSLIFQKEQ